MKNSILKAVILPVIAILLNSCAVAQNAKTLSKKEIDKWFDSKEWAGGLKLKVYDDVSKDEFYKQYHANKALWDKAFAYMRDNDLANLATGKTLIAGDDLYASVTEGPNKTYEESQWESHKKYIDLQYIVKGKEKIIVSNTANLTVTVPYDETKDIMRYSGEGKAYIAEPGTYYLFFPQNAHRPSIKTDGFDAVKKVVLKIAVAK